MGIIRAVVAVLRGDRIVKQPEEPVSPDIEIIEMRDLGIRQTPRGDAFRTHFAIRTKIGVVVHFHSDYYPQDEDKTAFLTEQERHKLQIRNAKSREQVDAEHIRWMYESFEGMEK